MVPKRIKEKAYVYNLQSLLKRSINDEHTNITSLYIIYINYLSGSLATHIIIIMHSCLKY